MAAVAATSVETIVDVGTGVVEWVVAAVVAVVAVGAHEYHRAD